MHEKTYIYCMTDQLDRLRIGTIFQLNRDASKIFKELIVKTFFGYNFGISKKNTQCAVQQWNSNIWNCRKELSFIFFAFYAYSRNDESLSFFVFVLLLFFGCLSWTKNRKTVINFVSSTSLNLLFFYDWFYHKGNFSTDDFLSLFFCLFFSNGILWCC